MAATAAGAWVLNSGGVPCPSPMGAEEAGTVRSGDNEKEIQEGHARDMCHILGIAVVCLSLLSDKAEIARGIPHLRPRLGRAACWLYAPCYAE